MHTRNEQLPIEVLSTHSGTLTWLTSAPELTCLHTMTEPLVAVSVPQPGILYTTDPTTYQSPVTNRTLHLFFEASLDT